MTHELGGGDRGPPGLRQNGARGETTPTTNAKQSQIMADA